MTRAIFDASLILKWYLPTDPLFEPAVAARRDVEALAPTLVLAELGNAFWKYVRAGLIDVEEACSVVGSVAGRLELIPDAELIEAAQRLSVDLDHPVYDCLYLALARRENLPLVTVDNRLATRAAEAKVRVNHLTAGS